MKYHKPVRFHTMFLSPIRTFNEKASERKQSGHDVIFFTMGEPDFHTPRAICEETIRALEDHQTHYAPMRGVLSLRQEISKLLSEQCNVSYDPNSEIIVTCGGAEALNNAIFSVIGPGDEAIIFEPAFMHYTNMVSAAGGTPVVITTKLEENFQIDPDVLRSAITERTRLLILNNPGNPTGVVYSKECLAEICRIACEHDLIVISDEIYNNILYNGAEFYSVASFPGMRERTLIVNGFSKTYAMTGWRLAFIAGDKQIMQNVAVIHQYSTTCEATFLQIGVANAMNRAETKAEVREMIRAFSQRREMIIHELSTIPGITFFKPDGAFYTLVDISATGMDGDVFAERFLEESDVAVIPARAFGCSCKNYIRLSFATNEENILEGMRRLREFVGKYTQ